MMKTAQETAKKTEVNWVTFVITSTGPQTASITNY